MREEGQFKALKAVFEFGVNAHEDMPEWVPLQGHQPVRTLVDVSTGLPRDVLKSMYSGNEVSIARAKDGPISLLDYAVLGTVVVEFCIRREHYLRLQYVAGLADWLPYQRELDVGLEAGCETHFPGVLSKLPKVTSLVHDSRVCRGVTGDTSGRRQAQSPKELNTAPGPPRCAHYTSTADYGSWGASRGISARVCRGCKRRRTPGRRRRRGCSQSRARRRSPAPRCAGRGRTGARKAPAGRAMAEARQRRLAAAGRLLGKRCALVLSERFASFARVRRARGGRGAARENWRTADEGTAAAAKGGRGG